MSEHRVYGPPLGAGKTTYIRRQAERAIEAGYGSGELMLCSYTRAAAHELASREMPVANPRKQIGTLHAFCFHAFDQPKIAESFIDKSKDSEVTPWNDSVSPSYRLSGEKKADIEEMAAEVVMQTEADKVFADIQRYRAQLIPERMWPPLAQDLWREWQDWKRLNELMDFTDMIERALEEMPMAPGMPRVGFFDEAQDFKPLELALVRRWGGYMDRFIMGGDVNQLLYSWLGATPEAFIGGDLPPEQIHRLRRSYRMARAVHENAARWIATAEVSEVFDFEPRDEEGDVRVSAAHFRDPGRMLSEIKPYLDEGKSVMLLAPTSMALDPVKHEMRAQGVPFWNPYRRRRGDWNPLGAAGRAGTVSTAQRIIAYLQPQVGLAGPVWTAKQLRAWSDLTKSSGIMRRGTGAKILKALSDETEIDYWQASEIFTDEAMERLFDESGELRQPEMRWLEDNLLEAKRKAALYPATIIRRHGVEALERVPQVILGTVHSTKGGEADVVMLCPDLSPAGYREWAAGGAARDSVIRMFYVGLSRARETVIVAKPATGLSVPGLVRV